VITVGPDGEILSRAPRRWLPVPEILRSLAARGISDIRDIRRQGDVYRVDARTAAGARAAFRIDPVNGATLAVDPL
jgi:hypothetical protein